MLRKEPNIRPVTSGRESLLGRQLVVGKIPPAIGWKEVKDLMREAGNVVRVNIMADKDEKPNAVVLFSTSKDAQFAIEMFQGFKWHGKALEVREDKSLYGILKPSADDVQQQQQQSGSVVAAVSAVDIDTGDSGRKQVFVCNLPYIVGWQDLKDLFREAGTVVRTDIKYDPKTGKSKGMGTVLFNNPKSAEIAISMFDGFEWFGRRIEVREDKSFRENKNDDERVGNSSTGDVDLHFQNLSIESSSWAEKVKKTPHHHLISDSSTLKPSGPWRPFSETSPMGSSKIDPSVHSSPLSPSSPTQQAIISPYAPKSRPEKIPTPKPLDILGPSFTLDTVNDPIYTSASVTAAPKPVFGSRKLSTSVPDANLRDIWQHQKLSRILGTSPIDDISSTTTSLSSVSNSAAHFRAPIANPWIFHHNQHHSTQNQKDGFGKRR